MTLPRYPLTAAWWRAPSPRSFAKSVRTRPEPSAGKRVSAPSKSGYSSRIRVTGSRPGQQLLNLRNPELGNWPSCGAARSLPHAPAPRALPGLPCLAYPRPAFPPLQGRKASPSLRSADFESGPPHSPPVPPPAPLASGEQQNLKAWNAPVIAPVMDPLEQ